MSYCCSLLLSWWLSFLNWMLLRMHISVFHFLFKDLNSKDLILAKYNLCRTIALPKRYCMLSPFLLFLSSTIYLHLIHCRMGPCCFSTECHCCGWWKGAGGVDWQGEAKVCRHWLKAKWFWTPFLPGQKQNARRMSHWPGSWNQPKRTLWKRR